MEGGGGEEDIDGQPVIIRFVCIKSLSLSLSLSLLMCVHSLLSIKLVAVLIYYFFN